MKLKILDLCNSDIIKQEYVAFGYKFVKVHEFQTF